MNFEFVGSRQSNNFVFPQNETQQPVIKEDRLERFSRIGSSAVKQIKNQGELHALSGVNQLKSSTEYIFDMANEPRNKIASALALGSLAVETLSHSARKIGESIEERHPLVEASVWFISKTRPNGRTAKRLKLREFLREKTPWVKHFKKAEKPLKDATKPIDWLENIIASSDRIQTV